MQNIFKYIKLGSPSPSWDYLMPPNKMDERVNDPHTLIGYFYPNIHREK